MLLGFFSGMKVGIVEAESNRRPRRVEGIAVVVRLHVRVLEQLFDIRTSSKPAVSGTSVS